MPVTGSRTIQDTIAADIDQRSKHIDKVLLGGLNKCLDLVLEASQVKVPMKDGDLQKSGRKEVDKDKLEGIVIYGDKNAPYALYQHERTDMVRFTTPGTGPKYLELAVEENTVEMDRIMGNALSLV